MPFTMASTVSCEKDSKVAWAARAWASSCCTWVSAVVWGSCAQSLLMGTILDCRLQWTTQPRRLDRPDSLITFLGQDVYARAERGQKNTDSSEARLQVLLNASLELYPMLAPRDLAAIGR